MIAHVTPAEAMEIVKKIVAKMRAGMDYDEAEKEAEPYLKIVNDRAAEIAKGYGMKARKITFSNVAR